MKQKILRNKPYGLHARFAVSLLISALICCLFFMVLYNLSDIFLTKHFENPSFMTSHIQRQGEDLQEFINKNSISSDSLQQLKVWERKQPIVLLKLYSDGKCIYSSFYDNSENELQYEVDVNDSDHTVRLQLKDKEAVAAIYSDFTYQYYILGTAISAVLAIVLFIALFLNSNQKLIRYICRLNKEVQILEGGNLEYQVSVEGNDEITDLAKSMNRMRESFQSQIQTEQKLYQANKQLITEMSHDLRTPLTGIMLYLEILQSHHYSTNEELQDYLSKIDGKARLIKQISDHLFEYSLDENTQKNTSLQNMQTAFEEIINSVKDDLSAHGFSVLSEISWSSCFVDVNEEYIHRIFENIVSNIIKYAEPFTDIMIRTIDTDKFCGFSVMNTCSFSDKETESTGIGIDSIRTMMQQMKSICTVEQTDTVFEISLLFPKHYF